MFCKNIATVVQKLLNKNKDSVFFFLQTEVKGYVELIFSQDFVLCYDALVMK